MEQQFTQQYHIHNSVDGTPKLDEAISIVNTRKFIIYRIVGDTTNTAVADAVGGYFVMPFSGYNERLGATVDTAGTTNSTTIDVNKNGTTIMTTKISIATATTSSRVITTTQPVIIPGQNSFLIGDRYSFDVDAISSTPAKGLSIFMNVVKTS